MSPAFDSGRPPFDCLTPAEGVVLRQAVEVACFAAGEALLTADTEPTHAFVLAQGYVRQLDGGVEVAVLAPGELFAMREVLAGRANGSWLAIDAVVAHRIPGAVLRALIADNPMFCAQVFSDAAFRLSGIAARHERRELAALMTTRIGDAYVRKPLFVDGVTDLVTVCRLLAQQGATNVLVRDSGRVGMFTTTDLRDALLRSERPAELAVREVARFDLVTVGPDDDVASALLAMIRHRVHRVVVRDGETILGVLGHLDLMSFVSNHSHLIALQIEQAGSIAELEPAAGHIEGLIGLLHSGGVKVEVIGSLVGELGAQLFAKTWSLVAPAELVDNSCLLVMGSEGRGEQTMRTDQDNALLLRDGYDSSAIEPAAARFAEALAAFGYPRCPGDIMLTNPLWRQPLARFRETLREWVMGADPLGPMHLAIFLDAAAVAGDASLLRQARRYLDEVVARSDAFLARFARAADQFEEQGGWWARIATLGGRDEQAFDLKKLGTFPIVHGVRALALEHRIGALGTTERLQALVGRGQMASATARDLVEALHFLMALKLTNNLRQRQLGQTLDNVVRLADLGTLERDSLKDSLAIIRRFRQYLQRHYRLDAL
jgi:CBS domain-containing protein